MDHVEEIPENYFAKVLLIAMLCLVGTILEGVMPYTEEYRLIVASVIFQILYIFLMSLQQNEQPPIVNDDIEGQHKSQSVNIYGILGIIIAYSITMSLLFMYIHIINNVSVYFVVVTLLQFVIMVFYLYTATEQKQK